MNQLRLNMTPEEVKSLLAGAGGPENLQANKLVSAVVGHGVVKLVNGKSSGLVQSAFDNDDLPSLFGWLLNEEYSGKKGYIQIQVTPITFGLGAVNATLSKSGDDYVWTIVTENSAGTGGAYLYVQERIFMPNDTANDGPIELT